MLSPSVRLMKSALPFIANLAICVLLVFSFGKDATNVSEGGTIDFRNRITGARLLQIDRDAYHYKWDASEPPELCDPFNNPAMSISKVTVTPTLVALNLPLAALPYRFAQYSWLILQWLMLLGTGVLWLRSMPSDRLRWLWGVAVLTFSCTVAWRLHAERGQAYVAILFVLACWMVLTRDRELGNGIWSGLVAGLLVALRPPLLLLVGPFILMRRRGQIIGAVTGLVVSAGVPMLFSSSCWEDYRAGMQTWADLYCAGAANPRPPPQAFPAEIEGVPIDVMGHFANIPFADSSLVALFRSWGFATVPALPFTLTLVALIGLWFWLSRKQSVDVLLAGIAAWSFLADLFLPALRNSYNDVLILNLVAIGLIIRGRHTWVVWMLLAAAWPLGWAVHNMLPTQRWIINLPTMVMIAAAVLTLLLPAFKKITPEPAALT